MAEVDSAVDGLREVIARRGNRIVRIYHLEWVEEALMLERAVKINSSTMVFINKMIGAVSVVVVAAKAFVVAEEGEEDEVLAVAVAGMLFENFLKYSGD